MGYPQVLFPSKRTLQNTTYSSAVRQHFDWREKMYTWYSDTATVSTWVTLQAITWF